MIQSRYLNTFIIAILLLYQPTSIYLISIGVLPVWWGWVNFGVLAAAMLCLPLMRGLQIFLLSIPFYIVLPNPYFETLSMWRPLVVVLIVRAVGECIWLNGWSVACRFIGYTNMAHKWARYKSWEKLAILLFLWAAVTLLWAKFPGEGIKQLLFIANAALIYPITVFATSTGGLSFRPPRRTESLLESKDSDFRRDDGMRASSALSPAPLALVKTLALSTGIIILIGYAQLLASVIFEFHYFWRGWADIISPLYYGNTLAGVFKYSNSWLSADLHSLRMFSIMPSSHAFAMVSVLFLGFVIALWEKGYPFLQKRVTLYILLTLTALAIALSGTRGVWVGMLAPLFVVLFLLRYKFVRAAKNETLESKPDNSNDAALPRSEELISQPSSQATSQPTSQLRKPLKLFLAAMLLVVVFAANLQWINYGLDLLRAQVGGVEAGRFISILDFEEESNVGRLQIWKESLQFAWQNPFGIGFDNFIATLNSENKPFGEFADERNKRYNLPQKYITAHNLYLQILVELSVVGVVLFILMWAYFFRDALRSFPRMRESLPISNSKELSKDSDFRRDDGNKSTLPLYHSTTLLLSLVFLWFLSYSFFDLTWLNDKILLYTFICCGILRVSLIQIYEKEKKETAIPDSELNAWLDVLDSMDLPDGDKRRVESHWLFNSKAGLQAAEKEDKALFELLINHGYELEERERKNIEELLGRRGYNKIYGR